MFFREKHLNLFLVVIYCTVISTLPPKRQRFEQTNANNHSNVIVSAKTQKKFAHLRENPHPEILSDVFTYISHLQQAYLLCRIKGTMTMENEYKIEWYRICEKSGREQVHNWQLSQLDRVSYFTLSPNPLILHSYLIFQDFQATETGEYSCALATKRKNKFKWVRRWVSVYVHFANKTLA